MKLYDPRLFGKKLREKREKLGLTQDQLALEVKTTNSAIAHYELGDRLPRLNRACVLCNYLNTSFESLLTEGEENE